MKKLFIWDIDGTLIKGCDIGRKSMDMAFFDMYGIKNAFDGIDMAGRVDSNILRDAYELHNICNRDSSTYFNRYAIRLDDEFKKLDFSIEVPGILQLLNILSNIPDFFSVLGTGNTEKAARIKLAYHNMNNYFPTGGFGDKEQERWQVIQESIENSKNFFNTNFTNDNIYVIGDTPRDIECGRKLGVKTVAVATGYFSYSQLKTYSADYLLESFSIPEDFFKNLNLSVS